jgi:hypothetical protein
MQNSNGAKTIDSGKSADAITALSARESAVKLVLAVRIKNNVRLASQPAPTTKSVLSESNASLADRLGVMAATSTSTEIAAEAV